MIVAYSFDRLLIGKLSFTKTFDGKLTSVEQFRTKLTDLEQMEEEELSVEQLNEKVKKIQSISSKVIETFPLQEKYMFCTVTEKETTVNLNEIPDGPQLTPLRDKIGILVVLANRSMFKLGWISRSLRNHLIMLSTSKRILATRFLAQLMVI